MSAKCVECGTPLDKVPLVECSAHHAYNEMTEAEFAAERDPAQAKIDNLHQRIHAMPDFPEDSLELRQILSDIVGMLETNFERKAK